MAARSGIIAGMGRVWEWCANPFHPYPGYAPFPGPGTDPFDAGLVSLRGACLHSQRCLRRASLRHWADPIGSEGAAAPVCPQNRAYGSVHGSSRKAYPPTHIEPVR